MPRRLRQTAVRFGIAPAIMRFAYCVLQKTMIFDVTYLMVMDAHRAPAPPPAFESLTFRFLGSDDVQRLSNEPGNCVSHDLARRLDSGLDLCYAALHGDLLASYC